ncbi:MAG: Dabb family protein [Ilumatobacteraceae bacterium]
MFRHVVMFKWQPGTGANEIERVRQRLDELPRAIPEISRYRHGPDAGVNQGNFDYVVVGDFDDVAGYIVYRDHPVHKQLITEVLAPLIAERSAVQYEID